MGMPCDDLVLKVANGKVKGLKTLAATDYVVWGQRNVGQRREFKDPTTFKYRNLGPCGSKLTNVHNLKMTNKKGGFRTVAALHYGEERPWPTQKETLSIYLLYTIKII